MQKSAGKPLQVYKWSFYDGSKSVSGEFIKTKELPDEKELSKIIKLAIKGYNSLFPTNNPDTPTMYEFIAKIVSERLEF